MNGQLLVLSVNGFQYEYHTNGDGSALMPATLALDWSEKGGIAGLCRSLTIYLSGEYYGSECAPAMNETHFNGVVLRHELGRLTGWFNAFKTTVIDLSDPSGVSDGMIRSTDLMGHGESDASDDDKLAIYALGQSIFESTKK